MSDYESLKDLFQLLKVKFVSRKHWTDNFGYEMAKVMHGVLLETTKATFVATSFITVTMDEVMAIDNTQWLFIHLYVVQN
jgi:hypothetical protein